MDKVEAAKIGAKWWTDQLRGNATQNTGDFTTSLMATWAESEARKLAPLTDEKLAIFQSYLEANLLKLIEDTDWLEDNPMWGSALRCIGVDYHPNTELAEAAREAGISELLFPVKTLMWLNPDGVNIALGHGGKIEGVR